ncbi:unnamed protein product [Anisakis simplex]|uniref:Conserved oligomeric Golgi complex subunit 2 n=1 Tax=Anisakis simplex TaxID=6269 RepID=A0A3P6R4D4_ANISI|nr:unnamed protein product [Anisakis simplex]
MKAHFNRTDFNVDRFVNLARRRATLAQIHNDLRVYLKVVQNAMIELINDDYADFVNLSSNLVGLKETIDKLNKDIESIWSDLSGSTHDVMQTAEAIDQQANELADCRTAQMDLSSKISLILALERLADRIASRPDTVDSFWLGGLSDAVVDMELWFRKLSKPEDQLCEARNACIRHVQRIVEELLVDDLKADCLNTGRLLGILTLISGIDSASSRIMTEVIDPKVEKSFDDLGLFLENILAKVNELREEWSSKLIKNAMRVSTITPFLDKCLLTYIVSMLDSHFGSVLVPIDNRLFHRCYSRVCEFIRDWPDAVISRTILKMIRDRFNLIVYFKLQTNNLLTKMNDNKEPSAFKLITAATSVERSSESEKNQITSDGNHPRMRSFSLDDDEVKLHCEYSAIFVDSLTSLWRDDFYLASILDKLWDLSMKLLEKYSTWLDALIKFFENDENKIDEYDGWRILCAVYGDCLTIDTRIFDIALTSIWPKIREVGLDVTMFGQCLSAFSSRITVKRTQLENIIVRNIVALLNKAMEGVSDIPRHYRWTKKPHPTEVSLYMNEAFAIFNAFKEEVGSRSWGDEEIENVSKRILDESLGAFCVKAEQVIESVEQTGSSLQRFKRKTGTGAGAGSDQVNAADTDEGKIRSQLMLDLNLCQTNAAGLDLDTSRINELIIRAGLTTKSPTDNIIKSGPIHSLPDMSIVKD